MEISNKKKFGIFLKVLGDKKKVLEKVFKNN